MSIKNFKRRFEIVPQFQHHYNSFQVGHNIDTGKYTTVNNINCKKTKS